jgi:hypothetical protein
MSITDQTTIAIVDDDFELGSLIGATKNLTFSEEELVVINGFARDFNLNLWEIIQANIGGHAVIALSKNQRFD